jgi:transposase
MKMTQREREELAKLVVTFHINQANFCVKTSVSHFLKVGIPRSTIYRILKKYAEHGTTTFLPKYGRSSKISDQQVKILVKTVNNKTGISQRKLGRRFGVAHSTISRVLKKRTQIKILKRKNASKYSNEGQQRRAQLNSLKVYRLLKSDVQLVMDDEKYFTFTADIASNRSYYTSDPSTTPPDIKFKRRTKFEPKLLVWMAVSPKGMSRVYVHRSKIAVRTQTYLNECIRKRLIPFINRYHVGDSVLFWPDLASAHYAREVQAFLTDHGVSYVKRGQNPPNVPQARPIEMIWSLLEQKVYENNWEAQNIDQLAKRITLKAKELDQNIVTRMLLSVKQKLLKMYRGGVYSVC